MPFNPVCEDTLGEGQNVGVSGRGFQPGARVRIYATAPGIGKTGSRLVGMATADANGTIDSTVQVPWGTKGFMGPGVSQGPVVLVAVGSGGPGVTTGDLALASLAAPGSTCGSASPLSFDGFTPPVANPPSINSVQAGSTIPVKFSLPGTNASLADILAPGYPQSAPVSCVAKFPLGAGTPTVQAGQGSSSVPDQSDHYVYTWKTDPAWQGCRLLTLKLADGSYHAALFNFRPGSATPSTSSPPTTAANSPRRGP